MRQRLLRWLDQISSAPVRRLPVLERTRYIEHPALTAETFGTAEHITYNPPSYQGTLLPEYQTMLGTHSYPAPTVLHIDDGQLRGRHALVTTADGQIIADALFNHLPYRDVISSGRIHYPQSVQECLHQLTHHTHYQRVFVLANYFGNAYYHWMMESLPRLWLWQQLDEPDLPVLVSAPLPDFARQTLALFGVRDVRLWQDTRGSAQTLLLPGAIHGTGIPSPRMMRAISAYLSERLAPLPIYDSPRIYITRQASTRRRVTNEDAVNALLARHGFVTYALEDLSLAQQMALFQQAQVVVGAHGAGFANCIHSEQITLLEFFEPSYINLCFYRLASGYGFTYGYIVGDAEGLNIRVDLDALEAMLGTLSMT
ncbi:MAG: glycosyltransferase family 61 protein [Anaerolineae bacterium]